MKKLLKVSLMAMLVAAPFAARAEGEPVDPNNPLYAGVDATAVADVASTSYVKGAYNDAIGKINKVANLKQDNLKNNAASPADVSSTVKTSVGATGSANDTSLVTEKAVRDAIDAATQSTTYQAGSGLALDTTTNTFSASGITTSNIAADAAIAKTQLASDVQTSLGLADSALQDDDLTSTYTASDTTKAVTGAAVASAISGKQDTIDANNTLSGAYLTAGTVAETALAQGVQDKLAAADSALQETDLDNTTIEVDGTSNKVQVKAGSIGTTQLASGVVTSLGLADTALQDDSALNGANLTAGTVAETALDSALATKINNAAAAKKVTVHTTWNSDSTTAPADVLVNAQ